MIETLTSLPILIPLFGFFMLLIGVAANNLFGGLVASAFLMIFLVVQTDSGIYETLLWIFLPLATIYAIFDFYGAVFGGTSGGEPA